MLRFLKSLFLTNRLFLSLILVAVLFVFGQFFTFILVLARILLLLLTALSLLDLILLFNIKKGFDASREVPERLSNGDENKIYLFLKNNYGFTVHVNITDEIPYQFQIRDFDKAMVLNAFDEKKYEYTLRPVKRGQYEFGNINVYVSGFPGLFRRRYIFNEARTVPVYPSFMQMRKYELLAISNRLTEAGVKRIRRVGTHTEFDQIREYVKGDDYRTINWKATAHVSRYMVNQYQDERSQQVYSLIDMGRTMKMPFEGMSLLDYAINASLVISNIAMHKHDKAGILTFSEKINTFLPADRKNSYMMRILELLYNQETDFKESNFELLYSYIRQKIKQRSLLILFTNFGSLSAMNRQKWMLQRLASSHLMIVILFENTELSRVMEMNPESVEDIYYKTIAEKFIHEKKQIVKELNKYGIYTLLTKPQDLTVEVINKYLELKALGLI